MEVQPLYNKDCETVVKNVSEVSKEMKTSERIRTRILAANGNFFANSNIAEYIEEGEIEELKIEVEERVADLLRSLIIDIDNDHNTKGTARRVAKMYLDEVFSGRYQPMPVITEFPNHKHLDEIYTLGPIHFKSACSHHFAEIEGQVWVGVHPSDKIVGISKIARLVAWVAKRPQIQEEATMILADQLEELLAPQGVGVVIKAKHHCMTWRGVEEEDSNMVTSVVRGTFLKPIIKSEFFELIKTQSF
jgi:GTP cyclohydrolase I